MDGYFVLNLSTDYMKQKFETLFVRLFSWASFQQVGRDIHFN